jgi:hypothetical protein
MRASVREIIPFVGRWESVRHAVDGSRHRVSLHIRAAGEFYTVCCLQDDDWSYGHDG